MSTPLDWRAQGSYLEAVLLDPGNLSGVGVTFTLTCMPTCYRRGPWCLRIEVALGPAHFQWGCFDDQDQPTRYYHDKSCALSEAQAIADVLIADRWKSSKEEEG